MRYSTVGAKWTSLQRHGQSVQHGQALRRAFGDEVPERAHMAPPQQLYIELYHAFRKGIAPRGGYALPSGIVGHDKANQMLWTFGESLATTRRARLAEAESCNLARDERAGRLHARYSCTGLDLRNHRGFLGQSVGHNPDALGLTAATTAIYKRVCTTYYDPPAGAAVRESFDESLYAHMCAITEAIAVDAAANEVVSATDMHAADFPNLVHVLRDGAHSARRTLSRLWKADTVLSNTLGIFAHWRGSIGQLIQHSHDLALWYADLSAASTDGATSSTFKNMRAAKHRLETETTPMSRCVLDPSATIAFAVKVANLRRDRTEGGHALTFLNTMCVALWVLAAMMCEGSAEAMELIRFLDTESVSVPDLVQRVINFLDRITWLFFERGVLEVQGHTTFILKWMETQHFYSVRGEGRRIGGEKVSEAILQDCAHAIVGDFSERVLCCRIPFH